MDGLQNEGLLEEKLEYVTTALGLEEKKRSNLLKMTNRLSDKILDNYDEGV